MCLVCVKGRNSPGIVQWMCRWRRAHHYLEFRYKHSVQRWWRKSRNSYLAVSVCRWESLACSRSPGGLHEYLNPMQFPMSGVIKHTTLSETVFLFESKSALLIFTSSYGELWSAVLYIICMLLLSFDKRNHTTVLCFDVKCCVGCYNNLINIQIHSAIWV